VERLVFAAMTSVPTLAEAGLFGCGWTLAAGVRVFGFRGATSRHRLGLCGLTFELTPTAEAGSVRLGRENVHRTSDQPYAACRSGSALNEGLGVAFVPPCGPFDLDDVSIRIVEVERWAGAFSTKVLSYVAMRLYSVA